MENNKSFLDRLYGKTRHLIVRSGVVFNGIGFWITFTSVLLLCMTNTVICAVRDIGCDTALSYSAPEAFLLYMGDVEGNIGAVFDFLYIFLLLLPFSLSYVNERKKNTMCIIQIRRGIRRYYYENLFLCFLGSFTAFFIPFVIQIGVNQLIFGGEFMDSFTYMWQGDISGDRYGEILYTRAIPFKWLFINHPQMYNLLFAFLFSCMCAVFAMLVYAISLYVKRYAIVLLLPLFLIVQLQGKIDAVSEELFGKYIEFETVHYFMVMGSRGQCIWYLAGFMIVVLAVTYYLTEKKCCMDQIN
ncbi:MAG: hypothetical protein K6F92_03835 [Lachnospiraceae bacterium]|nr:hypothetical protein [Lachnospiraceae bacterium]